MKCPQSGHDNREGAQSCGICGISLSVPTVNESGTAANGIGLASGIGNIFQAIGYLLILLGILDFITEHFLGKDFTGVT